MTQAQPLQRKVWTAVLFIAAALIVLRFGLLLHATNPLYIDEIGSAVHASSLLATGHDFAGQAWPLMSKSFGGGYTTGVYLYPLTAWASIFGDSAQALRAFSEFVTVLAIIILAWAGGVWHGKRLAAIMLLVGLTLPWNWVGGTMAWDPAITPLLIALGFLFFSLLARRSYSTQNQILLLVGLTVSFVLAAYSYPPTRVTAPLLLIGALIFLLHVTKIKRSHIAVPVATGAIASLPLLLFLLSPGALGRSSEVSAFHDSFLAGVWQTIVHFSYLLSPRTLFITGDPNLRHSTLVAGMLGFASVIAIVYAIFRFFRHKKSRTFRQLFVISCVGIVAGLLGSALTSDPYHYLRAVAAWPFFVLLISLGWEQIVLHARPAVKYLSLSLAVLGAVFFMLDFALWYPSRSADCFQVWPANDYEQAAIDYYTSQHSN